MNNLSEIKDGDLILVRSGKLFLLVSGDFIGEDGYFPYNITSYNIDTGQFINKNLTFHPEYLDIRKVFRIREGSMDGYLKLQKNWKDFAKTEPIWKCPALQTVNILGTDYDIDDVKAALSELTKTANSK